MNAIVKFIRGVFVENNIVGTEYYKPRKQFLSDHPKWMIGKHPTLDAKEQRQRWMNAHYCGETHPIDLP